MASKEMKKFAAVICGMDPNLIELGMCPFCGRPVFVEDFKDDLSLKEFEISGLCQKCQDEVFDVPDEAWEK